MFLGIKYKAKFAVSPTSVLSRLQPILVTRDHEVTVIPNLSESVAGNTAVGLWRTLHICIMYQDRICK
jgi:hypothetical protein